MTNWTRLLGLWLLTAGTTLPAADAVAGHYYLHGVREVGSELVLKPDGTFEFGLAYGASDYSADGTWKQEGGFVILHSHDTSAPPFRLVRSAKKPDQAGKQIVVKGPNGHPVPDLDVRLLTSKGTVMERTGQNGAAVFPESVVRSVQILVPVYQLEAGPYVLNPEHNDYQFEINPQAITQVRFTDERLKIGEHTLEMRHFDPANPMLFSQEHDQ